MESDASQIPWVHSVQRWTCISHHTSSHKRLIQHTVRCVRNSKKTEVQYTLLDIRDVQNGDSWWEVENSYKDNAYTTTALHTQLDNASEMQFTVQTSMEQQTMISPQSRQIHPLWLTLITTLTLTSNATEKNTKWKTEKWKRWQLSAQKIPPNTKLCIMAIDLWVEQRLQKRMGMRMPFQTVACGIKCEYTIPWGKNSEY